MTNAELAEIMKKYPQDARISLATVVRRWASEWSEVKLTYDDWDKVLTIREIKYVRY